MPVQQRISHCQLYVSKLSSKNKEFAQLCNCVKLWSFNHKTKQKLIAQLIKIAF